ncbi:SAG-related sequence [Besnoitia besnoiti]|uniref:SAG-related sequence n=1 Tax=Besnoitia besnoiti TaxID=94643 RepID=A0A2A9MGC5_BESBE|nr:SAG-related sequence [Besnoitia besnoiti]PFH36969.1 SAG-related sequence [Besnoitia besnoiti]
MRKTPTQKAQTIYFKCVSNADSDAPSEGAQGRSLAAAAAARDVCKVQVALWRNPETLKPESVKECTKEAGKVFIAITSAPATASFTCGDNGTMTPRIFERTFQESSQEYTVKLTDLLSGKLAEGGETDDKPIYTLTVKELPKDPATFYYKCAYPGDKPAPPEGLPPSVCTVSVSVAAANPPVPPSKVTRSTSTSTSETTSSAEMSGQHLRAGIIVIGIAVTVGAQAGP